MNKLMIILVFWLLGSVRMDEAFRSIGSVRMDEAFRSIGSVRMDEAFQSIGSVRMDEAFQSIVRMDEAFQSIVRMDEARADEGNLELMLGVKGGVYQTSGNLFADRNLRGWGFTLKLIPDDFGKSSGEAATLGGIGWMLSFDLDHISGSAHKNANFPFSQAEDIQLTWNVLAVYVCTGTQLRVQACLGLPFSNSLYLEQNVAGDSFNSFSMGNSNPPVFFNLMSAIKPWDFGLQGGTSYWNPTFAGNKTHFNLIQAQIFAGYVF